MKSIPKKNSFLCFVICIGIDQMTKQIAAALLSDIPHYSFLNGFLRFEYVLNPYGFLSVLAPLPPGIRSFLLTYGVLFLILSAFLFVSRSNRLDADRRTAAYVILAGGASNLLDRFFYHGSVIDFIQTGKGILQSGIFNLADLYILLGSFYLGYSFSVYGSAAKARR